jgi:UDP-MurNAc hydroxylase
MVQEYFRDHGILEPRVTIMLSGDSWSSKDGFRLSPATMEHFERYLQEKTPTLEKFYAVESRSRVGVREARDYFSDFFAAVPWAVRVLYRRRPVRFVLSTGSVVQVLEPDLHRRSVREMTGPILPQHEPLEVHTSTFVFRQCLALDLFSHLAISKRARYRVSRRSRRYMILFNLLFNLYEDDYLPLRSLFFRRDSSGPGSDAGGRCFCT